MGLSETERLQDCQTHKVVRLKEIERENERDTQRERYRQRQERESGRVLPHVLVDLLLFSKSRMKQTN